MNAPALRQKSVPTGFAERVPLVLRQHAQWVLWKTVVRDGKPTKAPFRVVDGEPASSTNLDDWASFEAAMEAWGENPNRWDGIGFVFTHEDPFCGIDLDDAIDLTTGCPKLWAQGIIESFSSYTETSPSGTGVKIFIQGQKTTPRCRTGIEDGELEVYDKERYFAVTGNRLPELPETVEARQDALEGFIERFLPTEAKKPARQALPSPLAGSALGGDALSDADVLRLIGAAKNGAKFQALWSGQFTGAFQSQSEADLALVSMLAFYTQDASQLDRLFRRSGLMRQKWEDKHGDQTYGQRTLQKALGGVREVYQAHRASGNHSPPQALETHVTPDNMPEPSPEQIIENPEPLRLAEHFLKHKQSIDDKPTLRRFRQEWWAFESNGYRSISEEAAASRIYKHVDTLWTPDRDGRAQGPWPFKKLVAKSHTVGELLKALPACGTMIEGPMPQWTDGREGPNPSDIVAFSNGLLDTRQYCQGKIQLLPSTPCWFASASCPVAFNPQLGCPVWLKFLLDVFGGDQESIDLLQEWFGINLVPDNRYEKLMMLVGPPRGGKGTVLRALIAMLGEGQAASTSFSKLSSRFGLAPLVGKLAAILPDAHVSVRVDPKGALETLKSVSGGDAQAIDRKGVDELPNVRLFCRFTIGVNDLPKLPDEAGAIKTRLLLLNFAKSYADNPDTTLKDRVSKEVGGIVNWALEGLVRLRKNGTFTVPRRSAAIVKEFEKMISPVLGFLDEQCEVRAGDAEIWVEKDKLFEAWKEWCIARGNDVGTKADFGQSLINANKGIQAGKRGPRGAQFPVYVGVRLCG
jgi:putative DNA primase/helicase